jgi:hypothetical protein
MHTLDGWWFAAPDDDGVVRLPNGDGRVVRVGETVTVPGPPVLYHHGLHATVRAWDALPYARGPILCRVRLSGTIVEGKDKADKACATERTVLAMADVARDLRIFALGVAHAALRAERAAGREPDPRSWAALETTIAWMEGRASDAEQRAAANAALSAAYQLARHRRPSRANDSRVNAANSAVHATDMDWIATDSARYAGRSAAWNAAWTASGRRAQSVILRAARNAEAELAAVFEAHIRAAMDRAPRDDHGT